MASELTVSPRPGRRARSSVYPRRGIRPRTVPRDQGRVAARADPLSPATSCWRVLTALPCCSRPLYIFVLGSGLQAPDRRRDARGQTCARFVYPRRAGRWR